MSDLVVDVGGMGYRCPECGAPIDATRGRRDSSVATLVPCGHEVSLGRLHA